MVRVIPLALLAFGCLAVTSSAQPSRAKEDTKSEKQLAPPKGLRVFFASHSLMWYVPEPLGKMAEARGIKDHKLVGLQSLGASKTLQHWNLSDDKNEAKKALKSGKVDVFVMSPISFPDEGIENFVKLGLEYNPNMRFIVQLSWGGGAIDNQDFAKGAFDNVDSPQSRRLRRMLRRKHSRLSVLVGQGMLRIGR